ncbi:hypothetical protein [Streptomyces sp. NPDC003522]
METKVYALSCSPPGCIGETGPPVLRQASFALVTEAFVGGVLVPPDDAAADHAALFLVVDGVGSIEGERCLMRP